MSSEDISDTEQVLIFFLFSIAIGLCLWWADRHTPTRFWRPPFTVLLFLTGIGFSAWAEDYDLGKLGNTLRNAQNIDPHVILFVLLPPLIFESSYGMDFHIFAKVSSQSLWLAGPGVVVNTLIVSLAVHNIFDYSWNWSTSLLLASILSATDPVAVVATLDALGAPKKLSSLIDGEALLNDGSAFVLFSVFLDLASGQRKSGGDIVEQFVRLALGALLWGYCAGVLTTFCLNQLIDERLVEISVGLCAMIATFTLAEVELEVSGVLSVVIFGLYLSKNGQWAFSPEVLEDFERILEQLSFFSEMVIFILSGVVGYEKMFANADLVNDPKNWGYLLLLYILLNVVRLGFVGLSYPWMSISGYGMTWKEAVILSWGGLRGAVGLSLGLLVELEDEIPSETRDLINFYVNGIVILTLLINGSTTELLYEWLEIYKHNPYREVIFKKAIEEIEVHQFPSLIERLKEDWLYRHSDWDVVLRLVPDFRNIEWGKGGKLVFTETRISMSSDVFREAVLQRNKPMHIGTPLEGDGCQHNHNGLLSLHQKASFAHLTEVQEGDINRKNTESSQSFEDHKEDRKEEIEFNSMAMKALGVYKAMPTHAFSEEDRCQQIVESIFKCLRAEYYQ